jgi:hypothetical protein
LCIAPVVSLAQRVSPVRSVVRKCSAIAWAQGFQKVVTWPAFATVTN